MSIVHKTLLIVLGFIALAVIRGGVAVLAVGDELAVQWLGGTVSTIFILPALVTIAVGGTSHIALIPLVKKSASGAVAAMVPGIPLAGHITTEVLILKQNPPDPTPMKIAYFFLGLVVVALTLLLRRRPSSV